MAPADLVERFGVDALPLLLPARRAVRHGRLDLASSRWSSATTATSPTTGATCARRLFNMIEQVLRRASCREPDCGARDRGRRRCVESPRRYCLRCYDARDGAPRLRRRARGVVGPRQARPTATSRTRRPGTSRSPTRRSPAGSHTVLYNALEAVRIAALFTAPVMPATSAEVWRRLGLGDVAAVTDLAAEAAWGGLPVGNRRGQGRAALPAHRRETPSSGAAMSSRHAPLTPLFADSKGREVAASGLRRRADRRHARAPRHARGSRSRARARGAGGRRLRRHRRRPDRGRGADLRRAARHGLRERDASLAPRGTTATPRRPHVRVILGAHPHNAKDFTRGCRGRAGRLAADARVAARSARSGSTTTTTTRPATCSARLPRASSSSRTSSDCPRSSICARRTTTARRSCAEVGLPAAGLHPSLLQPGDRELAAGSSSWAATCSFAGPVTFKKAEAIREAARSCPLDGCSPRPTARSWRPSRSAARKNEPALIVLHRGPHRRGAWRERSRSSPQLAYAQRARAPRHREAVDESWRAAGPVHRGQPSAPRQQRPASRRADRGMSSRRRRGRSRSSPPSPGRTRAAAATPARKDGRVRPARRHGRGLRAASTPPTAIVIATPVFFATVPAVLKILYDRCQPYWARRYVLGEPPPDVRRPGALLSWAAEATRSAPTARSRRRGACSPCSAVRDRRVRGRTRGPRRRGRGPSRALRAERSAADSSGGALARGSRAP